MTLGPDFVTLKKTTRQKQTKQHNNNKVHTHTHKHNLKVSYFFKSTPAGLRKSSTCVFGVHWTNWSM